MKRINTLIAITYMALGVSLITLGVATAVAQAF